MRKLLSIIFMILTLPLPFTNKALVRYAMKIEGSYGHFETNISNLKKFRKRQVASLIFLSMILVFSLIWTRPEKSIWQILDNKAFESAFLLAHAAFGQLGYEIQTWGGESIVEALNVWWFRSIYTIGIFLLFCTMLS